MKFILLSLLGLFNFYNSDDIIKHVHNASDLESVIQHYNYIPDECNIDEFKSVDMFIHDRGGDCEDFAIFACDILEYSGYETKVFLLDKNDGTSHAVCWYISPDESGIFSNDERYSGWDIDRFCNEFNYTIDRGW